MAEKRKRTRKARKRMPKGQRKNLRLWAEGARETILRPHIEGYADALERGWRAERDYLQSVCNEFHARVDWRLGDHEEPELPLPEYDPLKAVVAEDMDPDVERAQRTRMVDLNARIQRWLKYRVRKLQKGFQSKLDPLKDPWAILVAQLAGIQKPPKARQAYQQFMHEEYDTAIAPVVAAKWVERSSQGSNVQVSKTPNGPFRSLIARKLFANLSQSERSGYGERAKEEGAAAREAYEAAMKAPPSKAPEDKDRCIATVGKFLGPIMKGIFDRTGMHCCFLVGGPVPKFGGELRTIYASYGRNKITGGGAHFPEWAGARFNYVTELMKEYLTTAFSQQDKAEAALPEPLAGALYTMLPEGEQDDDGTSDSDESESDSNHDSDDTDAPVTKKRKGTTKSKGKARAGPQQTVPTDSDEEEETGEEEPKELPAEWKLGDPESAFVATQEERNLFGGGAYGRQQALAARRNALLLAPLKAQWKEVLGERSKKAQPRAQPKKRKTPGDAEAPVGPRKSQRLNGAGSGEQSTSTEAPEGVEANPATASTPIGVPPPPPPPNTSSNAGGAPANATASSAPPPPPPPPPNSSSNAAGAPANATASAPPPPPPPPPNTSSNAGGAPANATASSAPPPPPPPPPNSSSNAAGAPANATASAPPPPPNSSSNAAGAPANATASAPPPPPPPPPNSSSNAAGAPANATASTTTLPPPPDTSSNAAGAPANATASSAPLPPLNPAASTTDGADGGGAAPGATAACTSTATPEDPPFPDAQSGAEVMPAVELDLPEDTPEWLMTALHYLTARDLGCHYTALLKALVRLEESAGFEETSHTALRSSTARPKEVGKYVKGARGAKMKALPEVKNVKAFATKWNAWWDDLQPKWRQRGADGQWITGGKYGDEWGGLDCAGPNGTLSVVAALYFWGSASTHTAETQAAWTAAVQDATWMLEGLDTLFE